MHWSYEFTVDGLRPAETWDALFAPHRYLTYFSTYRRLVSVSDEWPAQGARIVTQHGVVGPLTLRMSQTVVECVPNERLTLHEEMLGGLWRDEGTWELRQADQGTLISVRTEPSFGPFLLRPLIVPLWPTYTFVSRRAMAAVPALVTSAAREEHE